MGGSSEERREAMAAWRREPATAEEQTVPKERQARLRAASGWLDTE